MINRNQPGNSRQPSNRLTPCALDNANSVHWTTEDIARINASWAGYRTAVYVLTNRPTEANLWARVAVKFARKVTR